MDMYHLLMEGEFPDSGSTDLDEVFFDKENGLREDVRNVLLEVSDDIICSLAERGMVIRPSFVVLTGSLCGPNWDEQSDIDLHIGVSFAEYDDPDLMTRFLKLVARDFNHEGYSLLDRSIEVYFQNDSEPHDSPGVYDIIGNHWAQVPDGVKIEVTEEALEAAGSYLVKVMDLEARYNRMDKREIRGFLATILTFWKSILNMRKKSMKELGRGGMGNIVFKQLRRNGALEKLADLIRSVRDDVYEVFRVDQR